MPNPKRIRRVSRKLAYERAVDRGLKGPAAGKFITRNSRQTIQKIRGFQYGPPNEIHQPGNKAALKQGRRKRLRKAIGELRHRRSN